MHSDEFVDLGEGPVMTALDRVYGLLADAQSALHGKETGLPRLVRDTCCAYISAARAELTKALHVAESADSLRGAA